MKKIKEKVDELIVEIFKQISNPRFRESQMVDLHIELAELSRYVWDLRNYRHLDLWECYKCHDQILLHLVHDDTIKRLIICSKCSQRFTDETIKKEFPPMETFGSIGRDTMNELRFYFYNNPIKGVLK